MSSRKRRESLPPTLNVGPVWLVRSKSGEERHVSAPTAEAALRLFSTLVSEEVRELMHVAEVVHAAIPGGGSDPGGVPNASEAT